MSCEARQQGDEMQCGRCGLTWGVDDTERPACAPRIDKRAIPTRALTHAVRRIESAQQLVSQPVPANPYGCHSNPRPTRGQVTHEAQEGWEDVVIPAYYSDDGPYRTRVPVMVPVKYVFEEPCQHAAAGAAAIDKRCGGCPHA